MGIHSSLHFDYEFNGTSHLPMWLPYHKGWEPQTASQKKPCTHWLLSHINRKVPKTMSKSMFRSRFIHKPQSQRSREPYLVRIFFLLHTMTEGERTRILEEGKRLSPQKNSLADPFRSQYQNDYSLGQTRSKPLNWVLFISILSFYLRCVFFFLST